MHQHAVANAVAVEEAPAVELGVFVETVVDAAIGDAWQVCELLARLEKEVEDSKHTAGHAAGAERRAAITAGDVPFLLHGLHCHCEYGVR